MCKGTSRREWLWGLLTGLAGLAVVGKAKGGGAAAAAKKGGYETGCYDAAGRLTSIVRYDGADRLVSIQDLGPWTTYTYDFSGRLLSVTPPEAVTTVTYDRLLPPDPNF
jgi:uncharacterized protein RhaS with RHS repeats